MAFSVPIGTSFPGCRPGKAKAKEGAEEITAWVVGGKLYSLKFEIDFPKSRCPCTSMENQLESEVGPNVKYTPIAGKYGGLRAVFKNFEDSVARAKFYRGQHGCYVELVHKEFAEHLDTRRRR